MNKSCLSLSEFQTDQYIDIKERLVALQRHLSDPYSDCYIERLLDVVVACVAECTKTVQTETNSHMESFLQRFLDVARRLELYRRKSEDFSFISSLGHGAFGRVQLVREITTGRVCAMKILKKSRMLDQHADYWAEREIMSNGESPWIVQLYYAYQDLKHLYMVMEYVPGGNLVSWMDEVEFMSEAACRFYAAETILALIDLHAMGFIHRDLKPDNLLLDSGGHLKLADFGTAVRVNPETLLVHCDAAVGTPDYLSPEVLLSQGIGGGSYGFEVDWWALGVVIYEMLYGVTPFYSETLVNTYAHIMNHETYLKFPENVSVSDSCLDFMKNLLCDRSTRLGSQSRDLTEVYNHPWFSVDWIHSQQTDGNVDSMDASIADWTWTNIRACRAPFQPHLTSDTDTSHFQPETDEEDDEYENQNVQLKDENNNVKPKEVAKGDFPESSSSDHKYSARYSEHLLDTAGSQLAFAGFSFSSSHPYHLALLSGLNLPSSSKELINGNTDSLHVSNINTTDNHQQKSDNNDINNKSCESINQLVNNNKESNSSEAKMNHANYESQVARLQMQLEDALTLSDTHLSEVSSLTLQLEQTTIRCRELESKLSLQEINFKKTKEEMERQLENAHAEAAANCSRLEAEVIKWKSLAQSEEAARQSAETAGSMAVATATVQLARRAAEVADRLGRPGTRNSLSRVVSPGVTVLGNDSNSPFDSNIPSDHSDVDAPDNLNSLSLDNPNTATELLINRMEEMARRAHRAENTAQEAADQLEAEKHFKHIYKETCAEKTDQLNEKTRELGVLQELYAQKCKMIQRTNEKYEAALRALDEIQQKVGRYVEAAQSSKESAHAASQRAALASSEAAQLRVELERMTQAYKKEQVKFSATVNKLTEVLSGKNPDTLELMWLASFQQQQQEQDGGSRTVSPFFLGSNSARSKVASLKGLGQQKRLNLQLNQRSKENKRLLSEINRLNDELSTLRKEYENKLRLNESHTVSLESELASLKEQLHSVSIPKSSPSQQDIDDDSLGLRHYHQYHQLPQQQHNLHTNNNSQNNYYQNHQHAQQQLPNHSILLISKQVFNSDNYSNLSNNNNNINGKSNHITECDSAVRKSFVRPSSTIPSTAQSSVSHETNVKYPNVNTNTKLGATKNRASGGNSRNPTELMLPSAIDELIPVDFKFYGILEFGPKRGKRNKLHWESCFAQLTRTHLMLWDIPSDLCKRIHELYDKYLDLSNFIASTINSNMNSLNPRFEMPINALYHARSVNSCDVCHERPEDLPRVFQIIYDRQCLNNNNNGINVNGNNTVPSGMKQSSSGVSGVGGGGLSNSNSGDPGGIPRKSSVGSSGLLSTSSQHPSNSRRIVRTDSAPSSHAHSISNLSNNKRSNHTENSASGHQVNSQSNDSAHSVESTTINTRGHVLQRILFRSYATCDLCQNSCSSVFHPPLAYQCTDCQIKLHAWHLENNDYTLPQCAKAVGVCLLRARTVRDKEQWMEYLLLAIKITKLLSSNIAILKSNNAEVPISSIQQQSNPAITTTRSISLLGCGPSQSISPSVASNAVTNMATPIRFINLTPSSDQQISHTRSRSSICVQDSLKRRSRIENSSTNSSNEFSSLSHQSYIPTLLPYSLRPSFAGTTTSITRNSNNIHNSNGNAFSNNKAATSTEVMTTALSPTIGTINNHEHQMSRSFTLGSTKYNSEDYTDFSVGYTNNYQSGIATIRPITRAESSNCQSNSYTSNNINLSMNKLPNNLSSPILQPFHTSSVGSTDSTTGDISP